MHLFDTVLGITVLLAIAVSILPLARMLRTPHTVLLTIVGCALALLFKFLPLGEHGLAALLLPASNFSITAEAVFFIFLPILIFESALSIDARKLLDDIAPILLLAVVGLLLSTAMVGAVMAQFAPFPLLVCLLLGAIVSATDPVAVIAIFKELGAPKRLTILVEGESLFNDATAIVMFGILAGMIASGMVSGEPPEFGSTLFEGVVSFCNVFLGGVLFGLAAGWLFNLLLSTVGSAPQVRTTLSICLAYIVFTVAEHHLHISGVMALVLAALVVGTRMRATLPPEELHSTEEVWESLSFWANSLIFLLIGLTVPEIMSEFGWDEMRWLLVLLAVGWTARLAIIYGVVPLAQALGWIHRISFSFKTVMCFGGLRGAVSLALALTVYESDAYPDEIRLFIAIMVTGFVLSTLLINAPLMPVLMWLLGLNKLSLKDSFLRQRAMEDALQKVIGDLGASDNMLRVEPAISQEVISDYRDRLRQQRRQSHEHQGSLSDAEWVQVGLLSLMANERAIYAQLRSANQVTIEIMRNVLRHIDVVEDATKAEAEAGFMKAVERFASSDLTLRTALYLHRKTGYSRLLATSLAIRYRVCFVVASVLDEVEKKAEATLAPILEERQQSEVMRLFRERLDATHRALKNLELQYPDYAREIQRLFFRRLSLRHEGGRYAELHSNGVISPELYANLSATLDKRIAKVRPPRRLRLDLKPRDLLTKVPFMLDFPEQVLDRIATQLKPLLTAPGEKIFAQGEHGDAMYFISSGSVDVRLEEGGVSLGSGDFFGEMALLSDQPRTAEVISTGYCQLLKLRRQEFDATLDQYPALREMIAQVALERTEQSEASRQPPAQDGGDSQEPGETTPQTPQNSP